MAAAAASQVSPQHAADLQSAYDRMIATVNDIDAYNDADFEFHNTVMEQSGIRLAANITRILFARARASSRFTGTPQADARRVTLDEHGKVLEAIISGDAARAESAMREHIARAWARRRPTSSAQGDS